MSSETLAVLAGPEFRTGLLLGAAALGLGVLIGVVSRAGGRGPAPVAGILLAAAVTVGLVIRFSIPADLVWGLVLVAGAGAVHGRVPRGWAGAWLVALPGAWLVAHAPDVPLDTWMPWFGTAVIVVMAPLVASADRYLAQVGLGTTLVAVSIVGVFFAVPDTEQALVFLGAAFPVALLGWPLRLASLGTTGAYVLVALLTWTIIRGGYGRPGSIVGSAACLGLLVAIPVGRLGAQSVAGVLLQPQGWRRNLLIGAVHVAVVAVASRVVAVPASPTEAGMMAMLLMVASALISTWMARREQTPVPVQHG
jgi:hypothetical protein